MSEKKFCPRCVAQNESEAKFCLSCGLKFDEMPSSKADSSPEPQPFKPIDDQQPLQAERFQAPNQQGGAQQFQGFYDRYPGQAEYVPSGYEGKNKGLLTTIKDFYFNTSAASASLLADPNAPKASNLIIIRILLEALFIYLFFSHLAFFNFYFPEDTLKTQFDSLKSQNPQAYQDITFDQYLAQFQTIATRVMPIAAGIGVGLIWFISGWLFGSLFKGGLTQNSPLLYQTTRSMRQLTGYLQIPKILSALVRIVIILSVGSNADVGGIILLFLGIRVTARGVYAYYLRRAVSTNVGYTGNYVTMVGVLPIITLLLFRL